ncbi:MAG: response regulator transcription factor [Clostridia bacterium]|nr:response regulator transcription factor [Clostridia bacterium]
MKKILVVEDDSTIHNFIKEFLEKENYVVRNAYSGKEALDILNTERIDLILLDLMLPEVSGEEIVKEIRTNIPIIVISAKTSYDSKVNVLLDGANDYITKPFDKNELLARIQVQLRKNSKNNLKYKDLELLQDGKTLKIKNSKITLTKTEYAILKQLLLTPDKVVIKTKLVNLISEDTEDGDENSLKVHISNMRKKIRKITEIEYIEAVWGIGFKMKQN